MTDTADLLERLRRGGWGNPEAFLARAQPVVLLDDLTAPWATDALRIRPGIGGGIAVGAANFCNIMFENPVGSGVLVVVDRVMFSGGVTAGLQAQIGAAVLIAGAADNVNIVDTRTVNVLSVCTLSSSQQAGAALGAPFDIGILLPTTWLTIEPATVLAEGGTINVESTAAYTGTLRYAFYFREIPRPSV